MGNGLSSTYPNGTKYGVIKNGVIKNGVIKNGAGGGARDTTAVAMEASWKGQCCGQEQIVIFSVEEASGREPLSKNVVTRCQQCSCWHRLYFVVRGKQIMVF